jgi:hypothetical protein
LRSFDSVDDAVGGEHQFVGFGAFEVWEIGGVSAIDYPWVEQIEVVGINVGGSDARVAGEELVESVDPGYSDRCCEQSRFEGFLGCLLRKETSDA